jgi:hypothetical protein
MKYLQGLQLLLPAALHFSAEARVFGGHYKLNHIAIQVAPKATQVFLPRLALQKRMLRQQHPGQVKHLSAVVRLRLCYGQGLGHWGQEESCWWYGQ